MNPEQQQSSPAIVLYAACADGVKNDRERKIQQQAQTMAMARAMARVRGS